MIFFLLNQILPPIKSLDTNTNLNQVFHYISQMNNGKKKKKYVLLLYIYLQPTKNIGRLFLVKGSRIWSFRNGLLEVDPRTHCGCYILRQARYFFNSFEDPIIFFNFPSKSWHFQFEVMTFSKRWRRGSDELSDPQMTPVSCDFLLMHRSAKFTSSVEFSFRNRQWRLVSFFMKNLTFGVGFKLIC